MSTTALAAGGLITLGGCSKDDKGGKDGGGDKKSAGGGTGCDAPIDAKSKQMRKTLQYVEKTPEPGKNCANCAQWEADKFGKCGGCKLFAGPVQPEGYCASYAPAKGAAAASAAPAASG